MQYNSFRKGIIYAIIILIIGMNVIPSYESLSSEKSVFKEKQFYDCSIDGNPGLSLVTVKLAGGIGRDNWYGIDNNFTISYESDEIAEIYYSIDGNWTKYVKPFTVSENGEHILDWYAVDFEGNYSEVDGPFYFKVDRIPPRIDSDGVHWEAFQKELFGDWYARFWTNATDEFSGMDRVEMYINEGLYAVNDTPDGSIYVFEIPWSTAFENVVFKFVHYDIAGNTVVDEIYGDEPFDLQNNQNIVSTTEIIQGIDQVYRNKSFSDCSVVGDFKLSSLIVVVSRKLGNNDWIISDVNITFLYEPEDITAVYCKIDDEDWVLYSEPLVVSTDGNHDFSWYIVDYDGNISTPDSISFKIDQKPPIINLATEKISRFKTKFTANVSDEGSGVNRVEFRAVVGFFLFGSFIERKYLEFTDYDFPYEWTIFGWRAIKGDAMVFDEIGNYATHPISSSYNNFHMFSLLHWLLGILGWLI